MGLKPPEHGVVCGVFLLGVGVYHTSYFLVQKFRRASQFTAEKEEYFSLGCNHFSLFMRIKFCAL
ncbi:MAG: hypothetical protein IKC35_00640 [Clostridia bacterium]|nr:hypothetical protein [Clostridia bacterium]